MAEHRAHSSALVAEDPTSNGPDLGTLSVVLPVYDERRYVEGAVEHLRRAAAVAGWPVRVIIVNDGGDDQESLEVLDRLRQAPDVEVVSLPCNAGRYAARARGLELVDSTYVLLLDARVEVEASALATIRREVEVHGRAVWNFDVGPAVRTPFALFWTGITKVWWRDYFRDRRHVAFTDRDFDRYPKGTTAFFAPTSLLREAVGSFSSLYDDHTLASDDTRLLRNVAAATPINLAPRVHCRHHVKAGARAWMRQCRYRGTTFVDGYVPDARHSAVYLTASLIGLAAGSSWALRRPRRVLYTVAGASAAAAALTAKCGGSVKETASVGLLTTPFAMLFGSGVLRGLVMASRKR